MASLYQRFSGKINTSRSFPVPPEASHLLGAQSSEEDGAAGKTPRPLQQEGSRPRFQYQSRSDCEEEDVSAGVVRVGLGWVLGAPPSPLLTPLCNLFLFLFLCYFFSVFYPLSLPGQKCSPCPSLLSLLSRFWVRLSPFPAAPGRAPAGSRKLRPRTFRSPLPRAAASKGASAYRLSNE
uniref:Uncharacterized protein n=1 Tax=Ficedula albicollis TaxID=59894 RepID=A0A803VGB6_FICAL